MLRMQRSSGRGDAWLAPVLAMPRVLPSLLHGHAMAAALALVGIAAFALAQLVEARYLRVGMFLHLALLVASGLTFAALNRRSRQASAAEAAGVAHDLRGPLISLQATLELLASDGFGALPAPARAMALRAAATSGRAADVVDRTLHRQGTRPVISADVAELDVVLVEVVDALAVQVRATGATVEIAPLPHVLGDPCALFRVFVNLLQNSLKYHEAGQPPRIAVWGRADDCWAEIAVSDEGIGILPRERSRVFGRHYRTSAGAERASGDGVGLATVRHLITTMGGTVWVDDTTAAGTTIRMRLPIA